MKSIVPSVLQDKQNSWKEFMETGATNGDINPIIIESWERCRNNSLPTNITSSTLIDQKELEQKLKEYRELLNTASPIIRQLYELVKDTQDVITIHSKDFCVIDIISQDNIVKQCNRNNYCIGSKWVESSVGTNAAELCIISNKPIQITGAEHYNSYNHASTCYAAPIHDPEGNIIAALNVAGDAKYTNSYIMAMTVMTAFAIEKEINVLKFFKV